MISLQNALPLLIFLIVSFLAFYFIETVILFVLNRILRRHWELVVDKLMRAIVRHRNMVRIAAFGSIAFIAILLFIFTPLADLLVGGTGVLRFLALVLTTTMLVIYWIGSRTIGTVIIERRIHLYVFTILSMLAFTGIMSAAHESYFAYEKVINQAFVEPILVDIEEGYEQRVEDRLLQVFRSKVKSGDCPYYDYGEKAESGITQFMFVKADPALADDNPRPRPPGEPLEGKSCVHETKFILTSDGKWYQVLEQDFN